MSLFGFILSLILCAMFACGGFIYGYSKKSADVVTRLLSAGWIIQPPKEEP